MQEFRFTHLSNEELKFEITHHMKAFADEVIKNLKSDDEELLTRSKTALILKIDLSTLWRWTKKGLLKSYSIENRIYYKKSEVFDSLTLMK